jgi:HSP20 family protein
MTEIAPAPSQTSPTDPSNVAPLGEDEKVLRFEEFRDGDDLVIRSAMPGIDPDNDVDITVRDHLLQIRAERKEEKAEEDESMRRTEFRYDAFFRTIPLPSGANEAGVTASYKDSILEVRVPCAEDAVHKVVVTRPPGTNTEEPSPRKHRFFGGRKHKTE